MSETGAGGESLRIVPPEGGGETLTLTLEDLLPDAHGNVVLFNDAGVTEMSIVTGKPVVAQGIAEAGAEADVGEVGGMAYYAFDSGPTLYCPMDVHVSIVSEIA